MQIGEKSSTSHKAENHPVERLFPGHKGKPKEKYGTKLSIEISIPIKLFYYNLLAKN